MAFLAVLRGLLVLGLVAAVGCGPTNDPDPDPDPIQQPDPEPDPDPDPDPVTGFCADKQLHALTFAPGEESELQDAVNSLEPCTTILLEGGTFTFDNAITLRQQGITLAGAGKGQMGERSGSATSTVLVFTDAAPNTNGIDVVGDHFTLRDLAIWNAKKDGLRIESSQNVRIQRVRTDWENEDDPTNGKYGIYPVKSSDVLVEDCEAYNTSDAGIYVGQTVRAVVRRNIARKNVAGIEIENTQHADVYENVAEDNTAGLVVFDLPGNPLAGTDVKVFDNTIRNNNRSNFGSTGTTVAQIPAGTGTFVMASRRVEITGNTYENNNTVDIAILSGLVVEPQPERWMNGGLNFATADVWIHGNTFVGGSGDAVDNDMPNPQFRPLGAAISAVYQYGAAAQGVAGVEHVLWDGIDGDRDENGAPLGINLCFGGNTLPSEMSGKAIVDMNLLAVMPLLMSRTPDVPAAWDATTRFDPGEAPFDCDGFTPALSPVELP